MWKTFRDARCAFICILGQEMQSCDEFRVILPCSLAPPHVAGVCVGGGGMGKEGRGCDRVWEVIAAF